MSEIARTGGGLLLSPDTLGIPPAIGPEFNNKSISWLAKSAPGQDQGSDGACAIFAFAGWAETMHDRIIGDRECLSVYSKTHKATGRKEEGLFFPEAYRAAKDAGWLPEAKGLERVFTLRDALIEQPVVAGYIVTPAWHNVSRHGVLDHSAANRDMGYHAVLIVADGQMATWKERRVYIENWWGFRWGWKGLGVMTENLHLKLVREMWRVVI